MPRWVAVLIGIALILLILWLVGVRFDINMIGG